ncbi:MAG: HD domain-containing protein, partial [Anaerolineae bacterium]|nr:HD domain-containing protein [Anaerolineae bacterium]
MKVVNPGITELLQALSDEAAASKALVQSAYDFAHQAHDGQLRRSGEPYITHCLAVAYILAEMKLDATTIAAALLHDVVEDTVVTHDDLVRDFGPKVAELVDGVTQLKQLPTGLDSKGSKRDREMEYLQKMFMAMAQDFRVILIKLADRLHNMRTLGHMPYNNRIDKARETLDIFAPIANRLGIWQMKWELEDLAFRYLDADKYRAIADQLNERRSEREAEL